MKRKSFDYFLLFYLLFLLLSSILFFCVLPNSAQQFVITRKANDLQRQAEEVAQEPLITSCGLASEQSLVAEQILADLAEAQISEIWLVNEEGLVLLDTRSKAEVSAVLEGFDTIVSDRSYWITGDFLGQFRQSVISAIAPVTAANRNCDYVIIHYPLSKLIRASHTIVNMCALVFLGILLFSLLLPFAYYYFFHRKLVTVLEASTDYANQRFNQLLPVSSNDEFSYINANLNYLANEIKNSEEYQRKFISNISHDFRSPLTSIKGYAEAMLDGTIPIENQEKYLNIILSETDRLSHLTQNLLTLNTFDDRGSLLNIAAFDLHEVIRSMSASFEILCRKKDLQITLLFTPASRMVMADKEKIQQVLYNLLDNAIKFSNPHSRIQIMTTRKQKCVFVSIKDSGEGIPKENLPKIWNRFYKSDPSRGRDKKGTGLGLAIVKEIIQAHGQNINVISTEGVGTEFIFTLDKA